MMEDEASQRRLKEALARIASGDLEECPVCLEVPAAQDARVLRCCGGIMCKNCMPDLKHSCPLCRCPFAESKQPEEDYAKPDEVYESPFTYSFQDYSLHSEFITSVDYSVAHRYDEAGNAAYTVSQSYTSKSYASKDYSSTTSYTAKDYTAKDYSSKDYSSSTNYTAKNYSAGPSSASYTAPDYTAKDYKAKDYSASSSS